MEEEYLNLKGKKDKLEYFRLIDNGNLSPRLKLVKEEKEENLLTRTYWVPEQDKVIYSEDEVRKFSLDSYGENIPYIDGELTIFNNYLFDFWSYYLNAEGLALYGHLKRFAYGSKDFCYPNFELISLKMDKSRPTIHNYLEILERYGFSYKFGVYNRSREGVEEGPIFKVRKKVPLLTEALIYGNPDIEIPDDAPGHIKKALKKEQKGLPERLRKEHEKYVESMIKNNEKVSIENKIDFEEIYKQWQKYGELIKASRNEAAATLEKTPTIQVAMDKSETMILKHLNHYVMQKISKPSFETFFKDVQLQVNNIEHSVHIIAPNEFARDYLQQKYDELIKEALTEYDPDIEKIEYKSFSTSV
ncbi:DnaA N-terminal domain-containing protein [Robertmurraya beringensis]|jgi:hypothetical protein|uniref:DnaA N-terminal domain-containing protein n=1 Tax=Robertmurraya beringensis TaxID=641660 RepID=A0ABV6KVA3_9BACI